MAKLKNRTDLPQYFGMADTEAAANGGVLTQIPTSLTTREKVGILIHSVEFLSELFKTGSSPFAANGDGYIVGLTQLFNAGAVPDYNDPGVIEWHEELAVVMAAGSHIISSPVRMVYPIPKLAHPASLYWFFQGIGQAAALTMNVRLEYSYRDLSSDEYQDIIQTIVLQNAL